MVITTRSGRTSVKSEDAAQRTSQKIRSTISLPSKASRGRPGKAERPRNENFTKKQNMSRSGFYPMNKFPYHLSYKTLDLRRQPHLYRPGLGEQGVLMVEPYKSELLPHWKFKDPPAARKSSTKLRECFDEYIRKGDFAGADMARKFIQMGFTRSRRYANHAGGRKYTYDSEGRKGQEIPRSAVEDKVKAESAEIFKIVLEEVKKDPGYLQLRKEFEEKWKDVRIEEEKEEKDVKE